MTAQQFEGTQQESVAPVYSSDKEHCTLTTFDRKSGGAHDIEMYYVFQGETMYMLASEGSTAGWVQNIIKNPEVSVKTPSEKFAGMARVVTKPDEDATARQLLAGKYEQGQEGASMSDWLNAGLPIAVDRAPHMH